MATALCTPGDHDRTARCAGAVVDQANEIGFRGADNIDGWLANFWVLSSLRIDLARSRFASAGWRRTGHVSTDGTLACSNRDTWRYLRTLRTAACASADIRRAGARNPLFLALRPYLFALRSLPFALPTISSVAAPFRATRLHLRSRFQAVSTFSQANHNLVSS